MKKITFKLVSIFVLVTFTGTTVAWAGPAATSEASIPSLVDTIQIPENLGTVRQKFISHESPASPLIVHLQDAHGSYEAQENIKKILRTLEEKGFDLIFIEGGFGKADPELIRFFDEDSLSLKTADYLARDAILGGAELFLLEEHLKKKSRNLEVIGIEKDDLYRLNLNALKKVFRGKALSEEFLNELRLKISSEASKKFNKNLKSFFRRWATYQESKGELETYLETLRQFSKSALRLDLSDVREQFEWPQLVRLTQLKEMEKESDPEKALEEKNKIAGWAREKGLPAADTACLEKLDAACPAPRLFFERFYEAAAPKGFAFKDYPHFTVEAGAAILQSELNASELFNEMECLAGQILNRLAETEDEKRVIGIYRDSLLLKRLFSLELNSEDYREIKKREEELRPSGVWEELARGSPPPETFPEKRTDINPIYSSALLFYDLAKKRESFLFRNLLGQMRRRKKSNAILITGGFHSDGFSKSFKKNRISFIEITPRISDFSDNQNYLELMSPAKSVSPLRSSLRQPAPSTLSVFGMEALGVVEGYRQGFISAARQTMQEALKGLSGGARSRRQIGLRSQLNRHLFKNWGPRRRSETREENVSAEAESPQKFEAGSREFRFLLASLLMAVGGEENRQELKEEAVNLMNPAGGFFDPGEEDRLGPDTLQTLVLRHFGGLSYPKKTPEDWVSEEGLTEEFYRFVQKTLGPSYKRQKYPVSARVFIKTGILVYDAESLTKAVNGYYFKIKSAEELKSFQRYLTRTSELVKDEKIKNNVRDFQVHRIFVPHASFQPKFDEEPQDAGTPEELTRKLTDLFPVKSGLKPEPGEEEVWEKLSKPPTVETLKTHVKESVTKIGRRDAEILLAVLESSGTVQELQLKLHVINELLTKENLHEDFGIFTAGAILSVIGHILQRRSGARAEVRHQLPGGPERYLQGFVWVTDRTLRSEVRNILLNRRSLLKGIGAAAMGLALPANVVIGAVQKAHEEEREKGERERREAIQQRIQELNKLGEDSGVIIQRALKTETAKRAIELQRAVQKIPASEKRELFGNREIASLTLAEMERAWIRIAARWPDLEGEIIDEIRLAPASETLSHLIDSVYADLSEDDRIAMHNLAIFVVWLESKGIEKIQKVGRKRLARLIGVGLGQNEVTTIHDAGQNYLRYQISDERIESLKTSGHHVAHHRHLVMKKEGNYIAGKLGLLDPRTKTPLRLELDRLQNFGRTAAYFAVQDDEFDLFLILLKINRVRLNQERRGVPLADFGRSVKEVYRFYEEFYRTLPTEQDRLEEGMRKIFPFYKAVALSSSRSEVRKQLENALIGDWITLGDAKGIQSIDDPRNFGILRRIARKSLSPTATLPDKNIESWELNEWELLRDQTKGPSQELVIWLYRMTELVRVNGAQKEFIHKKPGQLDLSDLNAGFKEILETFLKIFEFDPALRPQAETLRKMIRQEDVRSIPPEFYAELEALADQVEEPVFRELFATALWKGSKLMDMASRKKGLMERHTQTALAILQAVVHFKPRDDHYATIAKFQVRLAFSAKTKEERSALLAEANQNIQEALKWVRPGHPEDRRRILIAQGDLELKLANDLFGQLKQKTASKEGEVPEEVRNFPALILAFLGQAENYFRQVVEPYENGESEDRADIPRTYAYLATVYFKRSDLWAYDASRGISTDRARANFPRFEASVQAMETAYQGLRVALEGGVLEGSDESLKRIVEHNLATYASALERVLGALDSTLASPSLDLYRINDYFRIARSARSVLEGVNHLTADGPGGLLLLERFKAAAVNPFHYRAENKQNVVEVSRSINEKLNSFEWRSLLKFSFFILLGIRRTLTNRIPSILSFLSLTFNMARNFPGNGSPLRSEVRNIFETRTLGEKDKDTLVFKIQGLGPGKRFEIKVTEPPVTPDISEGDVMIQVSNPGIVGTEILTAGEDHLIPVMMGSTGVGFVKLTYLRRKGKRAHFRLRVKGPIFVFKKEAQEPQHQLRGIGHLHTRQNIFLRSSRSELRHGETQTAVHNVSLPRGIGKKSEEVRLPGDAKVWFEKPGRSGRWIVSFSPHHLKIEFEKPPGQKDRPFRRNPNRTFFWRILKPMTALIEDATDGGRKFRLKIQPELQQRNVRIEIAPPAANGPALRSELRPPLEIGGRGVQPANALWRAELRSDQVDYPVESREFQARFADLMNALGFNPEIDGTDQKAGIEAFLAGPWDDKEFARLAYLLIGALDRQAMGVKERKGGGKERALDRSTVQAFVGSLNEEWNQRRQEITRLTGQSFSNVEDATGDPQKAAKDLATLQKAVNAFGNKPPQPKKLFDRFGPRSELRSKTSSKKVGRKPLFSKEELLIARRNVKRQLGHRPSQAEIAKELSTMKGRSISQSNVSYSLHRFKTPPFKTKGYGGRSRAFSDQELRRAYREVKRTVRRNPSLAELAGKLPMRNGKPVDLSTVSVRLEALRREKGLKLATLGAAGGRRRNEKTAIPRSEVRSEASVLAVAEGATRRVFDFENFSGEALKRLRAALQLEKPALAEIERSTNPEAKALLEAIENNAEILAPFIPVASPDEELFKMTDLFVGRNKRGVHRVVYVASGPANAEIIEQAWKKFLAERYTDPADRDRVNNRVEIVTEQNRLIKFPGAAEAVWVSVDARNVIPPVAADRISKVIHSNRIAGGGLMPQKAGPALKLLQASLLLLKGEEPSRLVRTEQPGPYIHFYQANGRSYNSLAGLMTDLFTVQRVTISA